MYNLVENGSATGLPTRHIKKQNQNGETKSEKETKNQSAKWPLKREQLKIKFVRAYIFLFTHIFVYIYIA